MNTRCVYQPFTNLKTGFLLNMLFLNNFSYPLTVIRYAQAILVLNNNNCHIRLQVWDMFVPWILKRKNPGYILYNTYIKLFRLCFWVMVFYAHSQYFITCMYIEMVTHVWQVNKNITLEK